MTYIAVQLIQIAYSDDHRGRIDAEKRARIHGLPIAPIAGGVLQRSSLDAWSGYEPRSEVSGLPLCDGAISVTDELSLRAADDQLRFVHGPPATPWEARTVLTVPRSSWARVILNGKAGGSDHTWLIEFVVNAGVRPGAAGRDLSGFARCRTRLAPRLSAQWLSRALDREHLHVAEHGEAR